MNTYTPEQIARFWAKVDKSGGPDACWPWTATHRRGYGSFRVCVGKTARAHRIAWEVTNGAIGDRNVCHKCDRPICCNPAHLFLGSAADNGADMQRKGRAARGERSAKAKLTEPQVREIYTLYSRGTTQQKLAALYGCTQSAIHLIVTGKNWRHLFSPKNGA